VQAKRRDLEELAKSVGLSIGSYQGHDKQEFRAFLDKQISEKEALSRHNKVRLTQDRAAS